MHKFHSLIVKSIHFNILQSCLKDSNYRWWLSFSVPLPLSNLFLDAKISISVNSIHMFPIFPPSFQSIFSQWWIHSWWIQFSQFILYCFPYFSQFIPFFHKSHGFPHFVHVFSWTSPKTQLPQQWTELQKVRAMTTINGWRSSPDGTLGRMFRGPRDSSS